MVGWTEAIKNRFLRFRREIIVVGYAIRHPETPFRLRLAGVGLMLYLASPIDLLPIFVPFLGIVDDALLVPWGLSLVVRRLPPMAREDAEASAARFIGRYVARPLRFLVLLVVALILLWTFFFGLLWWLVQRG